MRRLLLLGAILCGTAWLCLVQAESVQAFSDVREHWAQSSIDHMQVRELASGYPDGTFRPEDIISRAEFTVLFMRALHKSDEAKKLEKVKSYFTDVDESWCRGYIELAREMQLVHGDGQGNFGPSAGISREEAVTILVNYLKPGSSYNMISNYSDMADVSKWALTGVSYAVHAGLINGYPDGTLRPEQYITRAQTLVLLENFLDILGQKYQFRGILLDVKMNQIIVEINDKEQSFAFDGALVIYEDVDRTRSTQLKIPSQIGFDVNIRGQIAYIAYLDENEPSRIVNLTLRGKNAPKQNLTGDKGTIIPLSDVLGDELPFASSADFSKSLDNSKKAMEVPVMTDMVGVTGYGQLIAVIDSGVDPGHPDLQLTSEGNPKIIDFIDFTNEGQVFLSEPIKADNGTIMAENRRATVSGLNQLIDYYRYGFLDLNNLPGNVREMFPQDRVLVVAVTGQVPNFYDIFYVDTDFDYDLTDEQALTLFKEDHLFAGIKGKDNRVLNVSVVQLVSENNDIKFGFDVLGHGTGVAGITGASGRINGVAPGAQILAFKILDQFGTASLELLEKALRQAAARGARVAVVSLGSYGLSEREIQNLSALAELMWKSNKILVCVAVGNSGPGMNTVSPAASVKGLISVGAFATPDMWRDDYGWEVEEPTLWYFSAVGPGSDGLAAPLLVAPGSAVSAYPMWSADRYRLQEGTSVAAPHVAGAIALLSEAASRKLNIDDPFAIYMALIRGAQPLSGFSPAEQGFGAVNLVWSWRELQEAREDAFTDFETRQYSADGIYGNGMYSKGDIPAELNLNLRNNGSEDKTLTITPLQDWIEPEQSQLQLAAQSDRNITLRYSGLEEPGLYSTFLLARDVDEPGVDVSVLQTVVVPFKLDQSNHYELNDSPHIKAGAYKRYFVEIEPGTGQLNVQLNVGDRGRARVHVISPKGWQIASAYAGVGSVQTEEETTLTFEQPDAGVWEVVVYSSVTLSIYDLRESVCDLRIYVQQTIPPVSWLPDNKYLVSAIPGKPVLDQTNYVTLWFWYPDSKSPRNGVVSINGYLYEIDNGQVILPVDDNYEIPLDLTIAW